MNCRHETDYMESARQCRAVFEQAGTNKQQREAECHQGEGWCQEGDQWQEKGMDKAQCGHTTQSCSPGIHFHTIDASGNKQHQSCGEQ